ncbi:MAG: thiamine pyrophosphate-binding protein [Endomicrobium sp.]|jgi:acetolactate synthase-1/2/3 large subunit|nr:thiamine pyrophosphate-binding protein [Endomicrobium sp.]
MIKLSDYIAKRLKEYHKVNHFFMVSGGGAMHLNDSLGRYIPYTANHHEQACSMAAEGYARVNQKLALVNVTTGPGGLNCLNGVFGQWTDSVPVLYISGQVKFETTAASCPDLPLRQLGDQEADIISVVKPLVKYAVMVTSPDTVKYHLDKAVWLAQNGRKGPVWLDIPADVQAAMVDEKKLKSFSAEKGFSAKGGSAAAAGKTISKLLASRRPLIVAGHGIRLSGQIQNFKNLVSRTNIPVVTTLNGFDIIESDNKNFIGRIGSIGQRAGNFALQNADTVLFLGTRNNIRQTSYNWKSFAKNAYKIAVDIDKAELGKKTVKADLKVNADLADFLPELLKAVIARKDEVLTKQSGVSKSGSGWLEFCQNLKQKYSFEKAEEYKNKNNVINPYYFIRKLTGHLKENDICVMANATATVCAFQTAEIKKGQRFITNSGNASMGYDLPAGIGAILAVNGKRNVVCIAGDGSIMMNLQELQTIKHHNLPVKVFVISNGGYSSIKQTQKNFFKGRFTACGPESGVSLPDFDKIAKAFEIKSVRLSEPEKISETVKKVIASKCPVICAVEVEKDYAFSPKLSSKKLKDGTIVSPPLEDMYPFLDRKEFEENILK